MANLYLRDPKIFPRAKHFFESYLRCAKDGGAKEKIRCGLIYAKGLGVEKNLSKARNFFDAVKDNAAVFIDSEFIELVRLMKYSDSAERLHAQAIEIFDAALQGDATQAVGKLVKLYGDRNFIPCVDGTLKNFFNLRRIGEYAFQNSAKPVESVSYYRRIEARLRNYFGERRDVIDKTRLD